VKQVYAASRDERILALGTAIPSPELLPLKRIHRVLSDITRDHAEVAVNYDLPPGNLLLRQQIARRGLNAGIVMSPDDIITTCGASEGIALSLMAVARRGDTVAIESPAYYGSLRAIEGLGLRAIEIATHPQYGIELSELDATMRRRKLAAVLLVPNFSNPLGACMPEAHKKELVRLLTKYDVPLIEDDIYGDLNFGPERPQAVKAFDQRGLVLHSASYSKTLAPGFRVGWVAPGRYRERLEQLKFAQSVATPTLPQLAIAEIIGSGGYDRHLRSLRKLYASQVEQTTHAVVEHFPAGTRVSRPQGGFVLWVEMPQGIDSLRLQAKALELGISIAPGPIFSSRERFRNCLRLSCGYPWSSRLEAALMTLGKIARQLA
jgi:DNA-binding transcriptional MocR family regulator